MSKTVTRTATGTRETSETKVSIEVNIDGSGSATVNTANQFLNHMIESFSKHSLLDVSVDAVSKDGIAHHLAEDIAITLGETISKALAERDGIRRFGTKTAPMDESLAEATLDLIKRQHCSASLGIRGDTIEGVPREDLEHFVESLLKSMSCCAHITVTRGTNDHHRLEAAIKALALSFREAAELDPRRTGPPSSKGTM